MEREEADVIGAHPPSARSHQGGSRGFPAVRIAGNEPAPIERIDQGGGVNVIPAQTSQYEHQHNQQKRTLGDLEF
jgi:hypothetical protein